VTPTKPDLARGETCLKPPIGYSELLPLAEGAAQR
jgi:hypothetical protein